MKRKRVLDIETTKFPLATTDFDYSKTNKGIGLIAPFDFALDDECLRWMPPESQLFITRTPSITRSAVTASLAKKLSNDKVIKTAVMSLLPTNPVSIAYACTSGSFVGGLKKEMHLRYVMHYNGAASAVTASSAMLAALHHLGIQRVAIATPYNSHLTILLAKFLEEAGFTVVSNYYFDMKKDIAKINYDAVRQMAHTVDREDAEAIFFSCTNLRTFDVIEELEAKLGKPVLSANQVTMWSALRAGNLPMPAVNQMLFSLSRTSQGTTQAEAAVA